MQGDAVEVPTLANKRFERASLLAQAAERKSSREDLFVVMTLVIKAWQVPHLEEHVHHTMGRSTQYSRRQSCQRWTKPEFRSSRRRTTNSWILMACKGYWTTGFEKHSKVTQRRSSQRVRGGAFANVHFSVSLHTAAQQISTVLSLGKTSQCCRRVSRTGGALDAERFNSDLLQG